MSNTPYLHNPQITMASSISNELAVKTANRRILLLTGLLTICATLALQIWRPHFYLTDDNFSGYLPGVVEFSRKLWSGQWPFISDYVYGGHHDLLADPSGLTLFSPWLLLFSWVALTPHYFALPDIVSLCNSLTIACCFCWSALWLRRHFQLAAPDWLVVVLSLSYAFTPYNLMVGSSWIGFLNAQAAFPLILVGFFHRSNARGIALQVVGLSYSLFGGHAHTFVILCVFSGLVSTVVAIGTKNGKPALRLIAAGLMLGLITLPLLLGSITGFQNSPRAAGVPIEAASASRIAVVPLALTYMLGPVCGRFVGGLVVHSGDPVFNLSLAFSVANLGILASLVLVRRLSAVSWAMVACFAAAALMITRPVWLAEFIAHIPLVRSLQWPFRELWLMHFAAHIFLLLNYRSVKPLVLACTGTVSVVVFALVFLNPPPTFYHFNLDRKLVFSGEADRYWSKLIAENGAPPRVIVGIHPAYIAIARDFVPFTLLGTYNFGSLFGFISQSGYTFTVAVNGQADTDKPRPYWFPGAYTPADALALWQDDPSVWRIDLAGVRPAQWTISYGDRHRQFRLIEETGKVVELGVATLNSGIGDPTSAPATE